MALKHAHTSRRSRSAGVLAVLLLAAGMGARISIQTSGPDEVEAMTAVARLISNGFGEG